MQNYSFAPPNFGPRENQRNYVFVDEHNRHKRLKVMRACEGCRRRKIKCDAATTNTWPCSACTRLKLHCVPPTINYDRDISSGGQVLDADLMADYDALTGDQDENFHQHTPCQPDGSGIVGQGHIHPPRAPYHDGLGVYQTTPYGERSLSHPDLHYGPTAMAHIKVTDAPYQSLSVFPTPPGQTIPVSDSGDSWSQEQLSAASLSDALGDLKIDETGVAPYISHQKRSLAEAPALAEIEVKLPQLVAGPGHTVRIPPELMPREDQAMEYFEIFFANVHPYVPVINQSYFYQQWHTDRQSISPLMLEAMFACAGRMSDDPAQGAQWLALASKHEDSFMDVPRLSTIQAMLLLLKARESAPKRGYYYRSWMTIKTLVTIAKELKLDEHYDVHQQGQSCGSVLHECITKVRVWQTIFICEMMIGGPQGRFDMGVEPDSVDFRIQPPSAGLDESDLEVSRQFTYLVRCVRNVRIMNDVYGRVRKKKNWGADPEFVRLNPAFTDWLSELPRDLGLDYPLDGSPPWLLTHFIGNLHTYYHLSIIMLHRPQLMFSGSFSADGGWKQHMLLCYSSAKHLCRLQEAVLQDFGLPGLLCMQRGISFTIYAVLTCAMLHLVALTSPDADFNTDAKDYFTRHMRILERCTSSWPMPEMQAQIDALREAFSADVNKPFELRQTFPYGSPGGPLQPSPPIETDYHAQSLGRHPSIEHQSRVCYINQPITPPISGHGESNDDSPVAQSLPMMPTGQRQHHQMPNSMPMIDTIGWNPSRIFDQWNTAFGPPQSNITAASSTVSQTSPPLNMPPTSSGHDLTQTQATVQQHYPNTSGMAPLPHVQQMPPAVYTSPGPAFVSPSMWRDTVASTFGPGGLKRRWDLGASDMVSKRQR
ncbi:MAG: hypothetical protein M1830_005161 [Pleopsidium flavum]|nr:MAG: hypothetical protein M1830_005161 [Pleopsidium flavum]